jgi:hypothetical protein
LNALIQDLLFSNKDEYDFIITSSCKDGIVNYDYTNDTKINKHILEVYKLDRFSQDKKTGKIKWGVKIPFTEFFPVQSSIKDSEDIARKILDKTLKEKQKGIQEGRKENTALYIPRIQGFQKTKITETDKIINELISSQEELEKIKKDMLSKGGGSNKRESELEKKIEKLSKQLSEKGFEMKQAVENLELVKSGKPIKDTSAKGKYKRDEKKRNK